MGIIDRWGEQPSCVESPGTLTRHPVSCSPHPSLASTSYNRGACNGL